MGTRKKAERTKCPACGQMVLMYLSPTKGVRCMKGHCKPGTDPKKSSGCDCPGSYKPVVDDRELVGPAPKFNDGYHPPQD